MAASIDERPFFRVTPDPTAGVIVLEGELDMAGTAEVSAAIEDVADTSAGPVLLDCRGVTYLDSSGIQVISRARARLAHDGRTLLLRGLTGSPARVLELCGLLDWIEPSADAP